MATGRDANPRPFAFIYPYPKKTNGWCEYLLIYCTFQNDFIILTHQHITLKYNNEMKIFKQMIAVSGMMLIFSSCTQENLTVENQNSS